MILLMIGLGGAIGALARYHLSRFIYARTGHGFPWGTLAVNLSGSFLLGTLLPHLDFRAPATAASAFLTVGLLGAFTTFSTFAFEAVLLLTEGKAARAGAYVGASIVLGLICIAGGLLIGGWFV